MTPHRTLAAVLGLATTAALLTACGAADTDERLDFAASAPAPTPTRCEAILNNDVQLRVIGLDCQYSGQAGTYPVPDGVTSMTVVISGGIGGQSNPAHGGAATQVTATLPVSAGQTLGVFVGGQGMGGGNTPGDGEGGGGAAAGGAAGCDIAGGGGGATQVTVNGTPVVVAAGGGGGGAQGMFPGTDDGGWGGKFGGRGDDGSGPGAGRAGAAGDGPALAGGGTGEGGKDAGGCGGGGGAGWGGGAGGGGGHLGGGGGAGGSAGGSYALPTATGVSMASVDDQTDGALSITFAY